MPHSSIRIPLLLIAIFFLTVGIISFLFLTAGEPAVTPVEQQPTTVVDVPRQQEIIPFSSVLSKTGTQLATRNFANDPSVTLFDEVTQTYILSEESSAAGLIYQIFYVQNGGITVVLLADNLSFARNRAESALQETLGVSNLEMCSMVIRVGVPFFVSEDYAGKELGLSFCPEAVAL